MIKDNFNNDQAVQVIEALETGIKCHSFETNGEITMAASAVSIVREYDKTFNSVLNYAFYEIGHIDDHPEYFL